MNEIIDQTIAEGEMIDMILHGSVPYVAKQAAQIAKAATARAERLAQALTSAIDWLEHADFDYRDDEGETRSAWAYHHELVEQARAALAAAPAGKDGDGA